MNQKRIYPLLGSLLLVMPIMASGSDARPEGEAGASAATEASTAGIKPGDTVRGKVIESMDAGIYTYVHVDQGDSDTWVAVTKADAPVGAPVSVNVNMVMTDFHSKTLDRTFDEVLFGTGLLVSGHTAGASAATPSDMNTAEKTAPANPHSPSGMPVAMTSAADLKIEKAAGENAYSIGEIFEKKGDLAGKPVNVRGKVLKVTANVMGKNWIHLQDGTGDPMKNTHDLVVTSASVPEMGQIVTATGVLATDKDLGAGYVYSVLLEEATFSE